MLRASVALFDRQAEPGDGFGIILRHALTRGVHHPEVELRLGVALLGGWFNTRRLLEPIGYVPPAEFEARYYEQAAVA